MSVLEEPYRSRAVPPGSARYWSWLFAAPAARDSLLGIYALAAEWRALTDPATETSVAQLKLAWWREELGRWGTGAPVHPITRYLANLPGAPGADLEPLVRAIAASSAQVAGVPLERAHELESHAEALFAAPLLTAARLAGSCATGGMSTCVAALGAGQYLVTAVADYRREAHAGRIPFAVDELLAAGIDNHDLAAIRAPVRLQAYLDHLTQRAHGYFSAAAAALVPQERPALRHLSVLAALGAAHSSSHRQRAGATQLFRDLCNAWLAARRAASTH